MYKLLIKNISNIVEEKVDSFTDSMIEDIQDIIKVEWDSVKSFQHGILPPRYKELKEEMKDIIRRYIVENIEFDLNDMIKEVEQMEQQ